MLLYTRACPISAPTRSPRDPSCKLSFTSDGVHSQVTSLSEIADFSEMSLFRAITLEETTYHADLGLTLAE